MPKVVAIVVAGGAGKRMGAGVPKQFLPLGGRPIVDRAISALAASPRVDGILLALPAGMPADETASFRGGPKVLQVVDGGAERQDSVANALAAVPEDAEVILVHDAVRPFVSGDLLARCVDLAREHGAVVPVVPVRETVKAWDGKGKTLSTVDRSGLFRAQ
ncbi:MAG: 2-C-methyl-D-erythritol 4-phosphate cytidylyltransferase, partial [Deltaproteobacteria bacterium]|nr:2-C-methyl-D-erythritol 4-phosphate cytidylyltransferase [Deltaproteobacteria bacterium]